MLEGSSFFRLSAFLEIYRRKFGFIGVRINLSAKIRLYRRKNKYIGDTLFSSSGPSDIGRY
jgi:hypothetical protein